MTALTISHGIVQETAPDGNSVRVYLPGYYAAEREVAQRMVELMGALGRTDAAFASA